MRYLGVIVLMVAAALMPPLAAAPSRAVILITLDGARHQEVFGGFDVEVARARLETGQPLEDATAYRRYWAETREERRQKLMPFFWGTLMRHHGSIAGDRSLGSAVSVTNRHWFSYPGYAEILLGRAHDEDINSNEPHRNPYPTVLEFLQTRGGLTASQAAVFASWNVFDAIAEHRAGALTVNAGYEPFESPSPDIARQSRQQSETPTPWDSVRHDAYTFRFAMDHLARYRPRVLYLAFGETDDWAHDGRYDRVLDAYSRFDGYLRELWTWLDSQADYQGRTSLLITTDHGRGRGPADWKDHGSRVAGANETWMAFVSPEMRPRGPWSTHPELHASQAAATLITWFGEDWRTFDAAAAPPVEAVAGQPHPRR